MLDLVPFARAQRGVADGDRQPGLGREALQLPLPQPHPLAMTAPAVGQDEQGRRLGVASMPHPAPPPADGRDRKGGGVVIHADTGPPGIPAQIVDPIEMAFPSAGSRKS